ncbi:MAG: N-acetylmuramoyl-L-alanine amidase [Deltaproteobacteria bacterium]|nr:N-acetylmuramoyl-L-alanine amidase [Deltaproteobacteria bacterium]
MRRLLANSWALVAIAGIACSDGNEPESSQQSQPSAVLRDDPLTLADAARAALEAGRIPAGLDGLIARLEHTSMGSRSERGRWGAASLLALRYVRFRSPTDRDIAIDRLARISTTSAFSQATQCEALARLGTVYLTADRRDDARRSWLEHTRRCPDHPAAVNVRASLAIMDPAIAQAASPVAPTQRRGGDRTPEGQHAVRRVVIDAGHGGSDPGARGPTGLRESEVTLDVARKLAEILATEFGVDVVLTRDRDTYVALDERARRANDANADLFVSIHCNASERAEARGVSVYALDAQSPRVEARFARRVNTTRELDAFDDADVSHILANLQLGSQGARSWRLAQRVQQNLLTTLRARYAEVDDMGVHAARFNVLVGTEMPAVLVEVSFVSNPLEEARLRDDTYRAIAARSIARAIVGNE